MSRSAAARYTYNVTKEVNESRRCSDGYFVYFPSFLPMRRRAVRRRQGTPTDPVKFWCGSGSADPYLRLMDPDPAIFVSDFQDVNKKLFFD
jgi:hypothetical protein